MHCQREAFALKEGTHYLNCAYMSPMLRSQQAVLEQNMVKCFDPTQVGLDDFFDPVAQLKDGFARMIGSEQKERIAIIPSVSYGIATVTRNVQVPEGGNIVMVADQFPSNVYAWKGLTTNSAIELRFVPKPSDGSTWSEAVCNAIDDATAVVAMPHVHWADGTVYDLAAISRVARAVNSLVIIDGTQSVGALEFPFDEVQPDALICAGYKWMLGPYSIGCAYYGPWFDDKEPIEYNWINRKDSDDFRKLVDYQDEYRSGAARFSVGENSNFMLTPLLSEGIRQILDWGIQNINDYCLSLITERIQEWRDMGLEINANTEFSPHLFGIGIPKHIDIEHLKTVLKKQHVHVSLRGQSVRVSPHLYNTPEDIDALHSALETLVSSRISA